MVAVLLLGAVGVILLAGEETEWLPITEFLLYKFIGALLLTGSVLIGKWAHKAGHIPEALYHFMETEEDRKAKDNKQQRKQQ